jgi:uncharacterized protein YceK
LKRLTALLLNVFQSMKYVLILSVVVLVGGCGSVSNQTNVAQNQARAHTELAARYYQVG